MNGFSSTTQATLPHRQLPRGDFPGGSGGARFGCDGRSMTGGYASNCSSESGMSYQGALEATKMWAKGRSPGSSSMLPTGRPTRPSHASPGVTDPQVVQNGRKKPGAD